MTFHAFNEFLQQKSIKIKGEGWNLKENCYENPSTLNLIHILSLFILFLLMDMSWIVMKKGKSWWAEKFLKIHQAFQMRFKNKLRYFFKHFLHIVATTLIFHSFQLLANNNISSPTCINIKKKYDMVRGDRSILGNFMCNLPIFFFWGSKEEWRIE